MSDARDPIDERRWEAVEEATELLVDRQWEPALERLRDAIQADPGNAYAYHYVGTALFELGKLEPAKDAFEAAVKLAPDYRGARVGLAHVLHRLGRAEEAIVEAREVLDRFPDDGEAMHALGLALAARGDKRGARRALEAFLRTSPELEASVEARAMLEMLGQADDDDDLPFEMQ
jgi:tetratricopeptide (TPR) repeat protein